MSGAGSLKEIYSGEDLPLPSAVFIAAVNNSPQFQNSDYMN